MRMIVEPPKDRKRAYKKEQCFFLTKACFSKIDRRTATGEAVSFSLSKHRACHDKRILLGDAPNTPSPLLV